MAELYAASQFPMHAKSGDCALARANHVFGTDEKRIRTKNTVIDKSKSGLGLVFIQDRRLCADVLFIRAQSAIRADGTPSAQARGSATTEAPAIRHVESSIVLLHRQPKF